jgi:hypothetical protein
MMLVLQRSRLTSALKITVEGGSFGVFQDILKQLIAADLI